MTARSLLVLFPSFALATLGCGDPGAPTGAGGGASTTSTTTGATSTASTGTGGTGGSVDALTKGLAASGHTVQQGSFVPFDLADCCATGKNCAGNNPASPYVAVRVPPAPGQTAVNFGADASGVSSVFRIREDEAIVYIGRTPPKARYFGFTPYLFEHQIGTERAQVFASLAETLNDRVIGVDGDGAFDRPTVVIATADATTDQAMRDALVAAGFPLGSLNTVPFDASVGSFGLDEASDTVGVLFRVAIFDDEVAGDAYVAAPPGVVLRVTPSAQGAPNPLPPPPARSKATSPNELALASSVDALGAAIVAANPGFTAEELTVSGGVPDPYGCINDLTACFGDNRDTIYPRTDPLVLFTDPEDFYYAYGVNHAATGKSTYASVSVYAMQHLVGVAGATDALGYAGSADAFVPGDPNAPALYAWKIARDCGADPHCLAIPSGACPTGIEDGKLGSFAFRAYVEPATATAPDPSTLVIDRIVRFRK